MIGWKPVNEHILTTRLQSRHAKVTIIQVYAPNEMDSDTEKDEFYSVLQNTLDDILKYDIKLMMGDFKTKVRGKWQRWVKILTLWCIKIYQ